MRGTHWQSFGHEMVFCANVNNPTLSPNAKPRPFRGAANDVLPSSALCRQAGATGREVAGRTAPCGPQDLSLSLSLDEDDAEEEPPDEDEPVIPPEPPAAEVPPEDDPPPVVLPDEDDPDIPPPLSPPMLLPEVRFLRQLSNSSSNERWRSWLKASQSSSNWRFCRSRHEW